MEMLAGYSRSLNRLFHQTISPSPSRLFLDPHTVSTQPLLTPDPGPLSWQLRDAVSNPNNLLTVQVQSGDPSAIAPSWLLTDGYSTYPVTARTQLSSTTEREGADGTIDVNGRFNSAGGQFSVADTGKKITLANSAISTNNGKYEISKVFSATQVSLLEGPLTQDSGPLTWAILPFPTLTLSGVTLVLKGVIEQSGFDLSVQSSTATTATLYTNSGAFYATYPLSTNTDIGKLLTIKGSTLAPIPGNDSTSVILSVVNTSTIVVSQPITTLVGTINWTNGSTAITGVGTTFTKQLAVNQWITNPSDPTANYVQVASIGSDTSLTLSSIYTGSTTAAGGTASLLLPESKLTWELRAPTAVGDNTQVSVAATSLISLFAPDFGIAIDTQESEERQRSWVANVTRWLGLKGLAESYTILGAISGFTVTAEALYHLGPDQLPAIQDPNFFEVGDPNPGRSGEDGSLSVVGFQIRFTSPTAIFKPSDVGLYIKIEGATHPPLNVLYNIDTVLSPTSVLFTAISSNPAYLSVPGEPNNAVLDWTIVDTYTDLPPQLPLFDTVREDELEAIVGSSHFGVDVHAWSAGWDATVDLTILSTSFVSTGVWSVVVTGPANIVIGPDLSPFQLVDSVGTTYYLESVPTAGVCAAISPSYVPGTITGTTASFSGAGTAPEASH